MVSSKRGAQTGFARGVEPGVGGLEVLHSVKEGVKVVLRKWRHGF